MSKKKITFTPEEMISRLNNGESAISISLDKWKRLVIPRNKNDLDAWFDKHCLDNTCALCYSHKPLSMCSNKCPLKPKKGEGCHRVWHKVRKAVLCQDRVKVVAGVKEMISVLEKLEKKEK